MREPKTFLYDERQRIARITLNRPDRRNALTFEVYEELTATLRGLASRDAVRAILLEGAGPAFCSGGDHDEIIAPLLAADAARRRAFTRLTCDLILAIRKLPKPVVAALHGATVGAGAVIAAASDIRIAAEDLRLGFVFVKVGLSGADMGAAWLLPRLVGLGTATQWLLTGEIVDAPAARRAGFLHEVVHPENLAARAWAWAEKLAKGPAGALAVTKESLNREASMDLETALSHEAEAQAALMGEGAFAEGFRAFKEKREPRFD
ncbi:MAG TPA: enoyl-CoA hydratase-related protein [Verrucomicrobiae bacterium]|nr:enoyl-CoA hydratase-related protein [Verrucomicrobiae bacterium]